MEDTSTAETMPVLFLGAGVMGAPMARNIHKSGYKVCVWNRSPQKLEPLQATYVETTSDLAKVTMSEPTFVIIMLSTGAVVEDVLFSHSCESQPFADRIPSGSIVICMSSIPVDVSQRHAEGLAARGIGYIDAPVSGGEAGAHAASLTIMAGGDDAVVAQAKPLLLTMGTSVNHLGPAGSGQLAKLANQLIVGVTIGAVAEAFVLAKTGGLSLTTMREALMGGFADSQILRQHGQRIIDGHFTPGAHATTQLKDLSTATDFGRSLGVDLPITSLVEDQYQMMCERGFGDLDHSALFKFFTTRKDKS